MAHGEPKMDSKASRLYDKRTVERSIKKGLLGRKDYEKYLKALDDVADKGVYGGPETDEGDAAAGTPDGAGGGSPS